MLDRALFARIDARPFALMRILLGVVVMWMLAERLPEAAAYLSDEGWLTTAIARRLMDPWHWSVLHWLDAPALVTAVLVVGVVAGLCTIFGLFTRPAMFVLFVVLVSVHVRNPSVLYGGDLTARALLFHLLLAPAGATWSLDALRARRARVRAWLGVGAPGGVMVHAPVRTEAWPARLLQIQIALLYLATGLAKASGTDYIDGSALHWALANPVFARFPGLFEAVVIHVPWLTGPATRLVLAWEVAFPALLVWRPARRAALGLGVAVHVGILALLTVEWWSVDMLIAYLVFARGRALGYPALWWRRRARARHFDERVSVAYDPSRADAVRRATALAAVAPGLVRFEARPGAGTPADPLEVHRTRDRARLDPAAARAALARLAPAVRVGLVRV
jgi:hypothetical protein